MPRILPFLTILLVFSREASAQSLPDTASYPYFIQMMQDPGVNFYRTRSAFEKYWGNRTVEKGDGFKVYKRWEWLASQLMDSLGNFQDAGILFNDHRLKIEQDNQYWDMMMPGLGPGSVACKTQGDWKTIGPVYTPVNNTSQINGMGRLNAVALHPADTNIIFVGAAAGGIWKSTDGGNTWAVNTDSLPTLGVSAIAIHPVNHDTMYFGSGDRDAGDAAGFGVFKSINGGGSWTISNTGMGNRTVAKLIIDPASPNTLLAACNGGIYRSVNAGASWTQTYSGGFFKDIIFKPGNSNVVYASNAGLFYRSLDNGQTWTAIGGGLPLTGVSRAVIDVNPVQPSLVYVWIANGSVHKGFYLSRDSGTTFRTKSTSPNLHDYSTNGSGSGGQAWYNMDMVTDPGNPAVVYCGGVNVFRSSDTGATWTIAGYWVNQIHADQHELIAHPLTRRIFAANDGGLYATRNRGSSWLPLKSGLGIAQIYRLGASRSVKNVLINGYQDNGTANYNQGWYTTRGGDGMDCETDQTDERYSYGELYYGNIFRVYNVNMQATIAQQGYTAAGSDTINESGAWVTPFTLKEGSGNTMYVGYKNIWRSNNIRSTPVTWRKISFAPGGVNNSNFTELENCIGNPDILYASRSNGTFFRSDNVNATSPLWTSVTQPVAGVINAIETDPANQNVVYIGVGNRVYRSLNKGSNWTQVGGNLTYNVGALLLDTSSRQKGLYAGTMGGGVWYTDTTLSAWRYFSKGLPNSVRVTDLEMYYEPVKDCNCNVLYAATYNRGNWYSKIYNDGTKAPVALIDPYDTVICRSQILRMSEKSCHMPGRFKWSFTPAQAVFTEGSDSMSPSPSLAFSSAGSYRFRFMAENCNGIDTLEGNIIVGDSVAPACIPGTTNNFNGLGIYSVSMAGQNRSSGGRTQEGPYVDLTCSKIFKVRRGGKYLVKVVTGQFNTEQVKAFVDFNNNSNLADSGECVYQPAPALLNHSDTLRIPANAVTGVILRMRIRSDFNSLGSNPCSTLSYGQTEDYGILVEDADIKPRFATDKDSACLFSEILFSDSSSSAGTVYSWQFGSGASPATALSRGPHKVRYSSAGYKKVVLNVNGKSYTNDSAVLIHPTPGLRLFFSVGDSSVCEREPFALAGSDSNNCSVQWNWSLNGNTITDSLGASLSTASSVQADSGQYRLIASGAYCSDTAMIDVHIRPLPKPFISLSDTGLCLRNNEFRFSDSSSIRSGTSSGTWRISDGRTDTGKSILHRFNRTGLFTVQLIHSSDYACTDSLSLPVQVYEDPVAKFVPDTSDLCFRGNRFTLQNLSSIGSGTLRSFWDFGDGTLSSDFAPPAHAYALYDTAYTITLITRSERNCSDTFSQSVRLHAMPEADFTVSDTALCLSGHVFQMRNQGQIREGTYSVFWDFGDARFSNLESDAHSYDSEGVYRIRQILNSSKGCSDTAEKTVEVYAQPRAGFLLSDSAACLKANRFVLSNSSSISAGTLNFQWRFGDGTSSSDFEPVQRYAQHGTYAIQLEAVSNHFCRDTFTAPVSVFPDPLAGIQVNDSVQCLNQNRFEFSDVGSIDQGIYTLAWDFGDLGTATGTSAGHVYTRKGFFTVRQISRSDRQCSDTAFLTAVVSESPQARFTVNDSIQCLASHSFVLSDQSISTGTYERYWYLPSLSSDRSGQVQTGFSDTGFHRLMLRVLSADACADTAYRSVYVAPMPDFSIAGRRRVCLNDTLTLRAVSVRQHAYTWKPAGGSPVTGSTYVAQTGKSGSTDLELTALTDLGCSLSKVFLSRIYVHDLPVVEFTDSVYSTFSGIEVTLKDMTRYPLVSRLWNLSNGISSGSKNVFFYLDDTATIEVKLTLKDTNHCENTLTQSIFYGIPNEYYVPDAFTPNGDGINDEFRLHGYLNMRSYRLNIYGRWGELLFSDDRPEKGWDGRFMGAEVPSGSYMYTFRMEDISGNTIERKGMVILIR